jgi:hypothetical protein
MALLSRVYMDCCNCKISKLALASASGWQAQVEGYGLRGTKFSPVNPCTPVLSMVKIFQESKVRTNFTRDLIKKPHSWPRGKKRIKRGIIELEQKLIR